MKKVLKIIGVAVGTLLLVGLITGWILHEHLPKGASGTEADALAHKMLKALNYDAYKSTRYL